MVNQIFWNYILKLIFQKNTDVSLLFYIRLIIILGSTIIFFTIRLKSKNELEIKTQKIQITKLIKDLEESKINFINIAGHSCYQSAYLQGFIHLVIPIAVKNLGNKKKLQNFIN